MPKSDEPGISCLVVGTISSRKLQIILRHPAGHIKWNIKYFAESILKSIKTLSPVVARSLSAVCFTLVSKKVRCNWQNFTFEKKWIFSQIIPHLLNMYYKLLASNTAWLTLGGRSTRES